MKFRSSLGPKGGLHRRVKTICQACLVYDSKPKHLMAWPQAYSIKHITCCDCETCNGGPSAGPANALHIIKGW